MSTVRCLVLLEFVTDGRKPRGGTQTNQQARYKIGETIQTLLEATADAALSTMQRRESIVAKALLKSEVF
jgi:hypothetical protein